MEIATPDTVIHAALARKPQYKKDLADIMELLSKAKANLGLAEEHPLQEKMSVDGRVIRPNSRQQNDTNIDGPDCHKQ
jgi:hypothetical protein